MKPRLCTSQQCRGGVPSLRCVAVAALVFALLAFASGAFAQDAEGVVAPAEAGVGESDAGPSTPAEGEASAEPTAEASDEATETPEEVAQRIEIMLYVTCVLVTARGFIFQRTQHNLV